MTLLPHHHRTLVALLRSEQFAVMSPDDAFTAITGDKNLCGLRSLVFVTEEREKLFGKKSVPRLRGLLVVVPADEATQYKKGIPGFPNIIRREDFDLAWSEVRGG